MSTSFLTFVICGHFDNSHCDSCQVILYFDLDLHSLMISDAEHLFMYLLAIYLYVISSKIFRSFPNCYSGSTPWHVGSYFFDEVLEPHPLLRSGVLATEPPETSPFVHFFIELFVILILNHMSTLYILNIKICYYKNINSYFVCKCFHNQQVVFFC